MDLVDNRSHISVIRKYPSTRDSFVNGSWRWIEGKRADDKAEELWRVHDKIYDLTNFITKHPGGQYWLEVTKNQGFQTTLKESKSYNVFSIDSFQGTDITEAFESHHITPKAGDVLKNYYVREAVDPRNYFFTYDENGFYRTLKKRITEKLKTVDTNVTSKSKLIHDINLVALYLAAVMMARSDDPNWFLFWNIIAGQCLSWSFNFSQNFAHQADNWRMYCSNIALINWRDFRIYHILSHHMYPNTYADFEVSCYEPYFKWLPTNAKTWYYKIVTVIMAPLMYTLHFHNMWRYRQQGNIWAKEKVIFWDEIVGLFLPAAMMILGKQPITWAYLFEVYIFWGRITVVGQTLFAIVHFNRGHHGTEQVHQNDEIKSFDFGEFQLTTTADRTEANLNLFTTLAFSGEQTLHHLFPALDAAILPQLKETFLQTCKEFKIRPHPETNLMKTTFSQFKQLYRTNSKIVKNCYSSNSASYCLLATLYFIYYKWW